jgi:hypothetical protein
MDRVYLAIIVSALLLLLGAAGVIVTKNADLMPPGRTVGVSAYRLPSKTISKRRYVWCDTTPVYLMSKWMRG